METAAHKVPPQPSSRELALIRTWKDVYPGAVTTRCQHEQVCSPLLGGRWRKSYIERRVHQIIRQVIYGGAHDGDGRHALGNDFRRRLVCTRVQLEYELAPLRAQLGANDDDFLSGVAKLVDRNPSGFLQISKIALGQVECRLSGF